MSTNEGVDRRRILFLTPQMPYPPQQGTALRNYNLIAQIARRHDVALLTFGKAGGLGDGGPLREICHPLMVVPIPDRTMLGRLRTLGTTRLPDMAHRLYSPAFLSALQTLTKEQCFDIIQVEGIELALYALILAPRLKACGTAIVFDDHNAEYALQQRACLTDWKTPRRWPAALYSLIQWHRLVRFERQICSAADAVIAVSPDDSAALERIAPGVEPLTVPNGVDIERYHPHLPDSLPLRHPALVYTGKMDYRPNVDAVTWFHRSIWPRIKRNCPRVHLYVVGKGTHKALTPLINDKSVTVTGFVPEILPYFGGADVYVAPLRMGSGTRLKILEAMAAGLPIVSTTVGVEGIPLTSGEHAILADAPEEFATTCCALLQDPEHRRALGSAARRFVVQRFDWQRVAPLLEPLYASL